MSRNKNSENHKEFVDEKGVICALTPQGLGLIRPENSERFLIFTFDKIPGYRGESLKEMYALGIREGSHVVFSATDRLVYKLQILFDSHRKSESFKVASCIL